MAIARDTTAANIKPLEGAIIRRFTAHAAIEAGELVSKNGDSNEVAAAISTSVILAPVGVAIATAAAAGDIVDVVVFGPVQCVTGATPGALLYATDTAGEPGEVGQTHTKHTLFGLAESSTVEFVRPQVIDFS